MLLQLMVKDLAIVEELALSFSSGMTTVTGETGAGKSIILQALSLALGTRADSSFVRHGKDRADISVVFAVEDNQTVQNFLQKYFLEDGGECVLRRVINADGKSKAFINNTSVPLSVVRSLGDLLIDMHGQNEHQLLLRPEQQLILLDNYAQLNAHKFQLNTQVTAYKTLKTKIEDLHNSQTLAQQQKELYTHQLNEMVDAQLNQDELNNIEKDFKVRANAQMLIEKTTSVLNQLESESGVNAELLSLSQHLSQALAMDDKLANSFELLGSAQLQTQEVIYELNNYLSNLSIDEESISFMETRISQLHELSRKHNCQIPDLLSVQERIEQQLSDIDSNNTTIEQMSEQLLVIKQQYKTQTAKLSKIREDKAKQLSKLVTDTLQVLGMSGSEFMIDLPKKTHGVHLNGAESVDFLVKTNRGQDFKLLKKIASGGELSRISLAISVVNSNSDYTPTLIFDEVDIGISGSVAEVVGRKLRELAKNYQVICITHLAQVAAFGYQHLRVSKAQGDRGVQTTVKQLNATDRVDEIARILSGSAITDKSRKAAAEMIGFSS